MANTDKEIAIIRNKGSTTADPQMIFSGASSTLTAQNICATIYPTCSGTLSFDGSAGQLFSITNSLTGTIFSVNDVSGIPSIDVNASGLVRLAPYGGSVSIGRCNNVYMGTGTGTCTTTGVCNVGIGVNTLYCNTTGSNSVAIGTCALYNSNATGGNIAVGCLSGAATTTGQNNVSIGQLSLRCNTTGCGNISIGFQTLQCSTTGYNNVALGTSVLRNNTFGYDNFGVGYGTLFSNTTGALNIAIGLCAACSNTEGSQNIALGLRTLKSNTIGNHNYAIGGYALCSNTTGCNNIAIGYSALPLNTIGVSNLGIGLNAGGALTTGNYNIAIGSSSLFRNVTGSDSISIGRSSLEFYTGATGSTIAIGLCAGCAITTGVNNTVIGQLPGGAACVCTLLLGAGTCERIRVDNSGLYVNGSLVSAGVATPTALGTVFGYTTGSGNTSIGCCSGNTTQTGTDNIAIGCLSLLSNTTGIDNLAIGYCSLGGNTSGSNNIAIGRTALKPNTVQNNNIAIGSYAMSTCMMGCFNIAIGCCAMLCQTCACNYGNGFYGLCPGNCSIAIGIGAAANSCGSISSIAIGYNATLSPYQTIYGTRCGSNCTIVIGHCAHSCGYNNIIIGTCAGYTSDSTQRNNSIVIGTSTYICQRAPSATWTAISDARDKIEVENIPIGLDLIREIRPVKFKWQIRNTNSNHPRWGMPDSGFIAQELLAAANKYSANSWLKLAEDSNPNELVADPGRLVPVLVKAVQELDSSIEKLKTDVAALQASMNP